ncbi:hypothetical protein JVT61DRAFT_10726 [Boletus reticuloceps]|uniref:Uncharacterized protein n=1 Tax=Boletus reticuloceps TaxID=495285 RepID=A0A8I2YFQ4_9AGAM|nr:hypothetical protein JVT61DRAFT_10726 [Boletus reticuloceps]
MADDNPAPTHCTRPSNVNKHPTDILKPAKKRRTKAEKATDDQRLKDAKAAQEKATVKGIGHLVTMEMEAESKEAEAQENRPQPVHPRPWPRVRKATDGSSTAMNQSSTASDIIAKSINLADSNGDPNMGQAGQNVKKPSVSLKDSLQAWKAWHKAETQQKQRECIYD